MDGGKELCGNENICSILDGEANSENEEGTSLACPIFVEDDGMDSSRDVRTESASVQKHRVRSMIAERTTIIDDERFLVLNDDEIEDVKQEDFDKSGIFTKRVGEIKVKGEDITVIDSESDEEIINKRKIQFVQGIPSKRTKGE